MNVVSYALFAYALTAVISFAVIGVVVCVNKLLMSFSSVSKGDEGE